MLDIVFLIILLLLSGFFSGTEVALISVSKIKARTLLKQKRRGARSLCKLKEIPEKMIITILIGNNVVNIAAAAMATIIATDAFGDAGVGIATGIMTFLVLVFGEITPKTFAARHAERVSLLVAKPILYLSYILYPLIVMFHGITNVIMKLLKIEKKTSYLTEEELKTMIEISAEKDIIGIREKELLEGVLEFNDIRAEEVMEPLKKVFCVNANLPIKSALKLINKSQFSRVPVYSGPMNKITGIVHVKEILNAIENKKTNKRIKEIADAPVFVPCDMKLNRLFREFQIYQVHMAIIINKAKNVIGLVTLEDLMEEIVGEIMDEKDLSAGNIVRIDKRTIVAHGKTEIERINKFFNIELPSKAHKTIGEFVRHRIKKPKRDAKLETDDLVLKIRDMEKDEITKVSLKKKKKIFQKLDDYIKKPAPKK